MSEDQCGRLEEGRDSVKIMGSWTKVWMFVNSIEQQHKYSSRTPSLNTHLDYIVFYFFIESAPDHSAETHSDVQQIASPCLLSLALSVGKFQTSFLNLAYVITSKTVTSDEIVFSLFCLYILIYKKYNYFHEI